MYPLAELLFVDSLVKEYLLFRRFARILQPFSTDLAQGKGLGSKLTTWKYAHFSGNACATAMNSLAKPFVPDPSFFFACLVNLYDCFMWRLSAINRASRILVSEYKRNKPIQLIDVLSTHTLNTGWPVRFKRRGA